MSKVKQIIEQLNTLTEADKKQVVGLIKEMVEEEDNGRVVVDKESHIFTRGEIPERNLFEKLASIEHERWADWQKYLHSKCTKDSNGNLIIPKELVDRWERQIETPYDELTEKEKDSDREQVKRYWDLINNDDNV